ncbi:Myosin-1 [Camellia lanceoleosa]|uniref:Myosin-1 n=1 Tax=Camellia lanceoleosa TaxID=1840588 RepID=A0ACC0H1I2_9ERIC|nr:Myosin-1 [Camellia lanceoleosa]
MKSSAYSLDSLVIASYFPLTQCIEGLKVLVELLFGVTFRSIPLAPRESWHTDVLKMSLYHPDKVFASSLLTQSEKPVVGALYKSGGADSQKLSVAAKFKGQLFQLMQCLESTTPHFIRCIKPNNVQSPGMYEQELVLQQLRCYGVLEVVRISRSGFPTRMTHQKFAIRYGFLLLDNVASQDPLVFQLQFFISSIFCLRCIKLATQNCFSALASDRTKYYLLASFVLHIKHSESKDSVVSPRILLSGPAVMSRSYKHCREVLEYLN